LSSDDENYELLELIDTEIERISSMTHQMDQLYRPSQQSPRQFILRRTIDDVLVLAEPLAGESNVRMVVEEIESTSNKQLDPSDVVLREGESKQMLLNVVRYAIQASPPWRQRRHRCLDNARRGKHTRVG